MRLVDQDRKVPVPILCGDILQNELELMNDGNDDFLALVEQRFQFAGALRPPHRGRYLHELPDRVLDLLVQVDAVGHDDDRIENLVPVGIFQCDQLMGKPCDGVGFSGSG